MTFFFIKFVNNIDINSRLNNIDINSRLLSCFSVSKVNLKSQTIIIMYSKLLGDMMIGIKLDKSDKIPLKILIYIPVTYVVCLID